MLHGFARLAFFAERTAKPLSDYRIGNRESGIGKSGIGHRASGIGNRASGIGHRASGIGHRASGIGHRASGIGHRASGIGHRASGIGHRELVSCRGFLKHFSRRLSINLEPSPPRTFSPSPFCNRCVWFKKRSSALIKLYSQKYYFFKFLYYR
jgi:hypothetical protein